MTAETSDVFADVIAGNSEHASSYHAVQADGRARKHLAVVTCIDSRIDPLAMLGLRPGEAKILRNAGARATDDTLRGLLLAAYLLGFIPDLIQSALAMPSGGWTRSTG